MRACLNSKMLTQASFRLFIFPPFLPFELTAGSGSQSDDALTISADPLHGR